MDYQFHDLNGKHVFITGGGSGIGAALTEGFLKQGARVSFVQRRDATDFLSEMHEKTGAQPMFVPCDITNVEALKAAMDKACATHGDIDVLVNNAGNDVRHATEGFSVADWDQNHAVNLRPYFFAAQHVAEKMKTRKRGMIINYSSISYMMGNAGFPAYIAANSAITGLTRALARELGPWHIRVNAIAPGWVLTQKQQDLWATPEGLKAHIDRQCIPEHLVEADMVGGTLFLASNASRMMTSQVMVIDGGVVVTG